METTNIKKHIKVPSLSIGKAFKEIGRNAYVDWIMVLILSLVLIIVVAILGFNLYRRVIDVDTSSVKASTQDTNNVLKNFSKDSLLSVLKLFEKKEETRQGIRDGFIDGVSINSSLYDPSL